MPTTCPDGDIYASAVLDKDDSGAIIIKVVNAGSNDAPVTIKLNGIKGEHKMTSTTLAACNITSMENVNYTRVADVIDCDNSLTHPDNVVPVVESTTISTPSFTINTPARSLTVYRIK